MRFAKTLSTFALALTGLFLCASAQAEYNYTTNNGTITITGCLDSGGALTIPSTINGLPVTSIGAYAFESSTNLTSVIIPNSVSSIERNAFYRCSGLTNVTIPNSVVSIGDWAFEYCSGLADVTIPNSVFYIGEESFRGTSLTSMTIPRSVTYIGDGAFSGCKLLTTIILDEPNNYYSCLDGVLFNKSQTVLVQYPGNKVGSNYTIPSSVTSIWVEAFDSCGNLTSVLIPNNVSNICACAFRDCIGLTSVTIPSSVTSIATYAFLRCANLTGVYFKGNEPTYGRDIFDNAYDNMGVAKNSKATIYYLPWTTGWGWIFGGCPTKLLIPRPPSTLEINVNKMKTIQVTMHVTPTTQYQLEASLDLMTWTKVGNPFVASTSEVVQELNPVGGGQYFRLSEVP